MSRMTMKYYLALVVLIGLVTSDENHGDDDECIREEFNHVFPPVTIKCLQGNEKCTKELHDVAVIHKFKMITGSCGPYDYGIEHNGRSAENATVWVRNCFGLFEVEYLAAHCENVELNSQAAGNGYVTKWLTDHPCVDASIYKMRVFKEESDNICVSGVTFSFVNYNESGTIKPVIWADNGCSASFHVCEIGNMPEGEDHDHGHDDH